MFEDYTREDLLFDLNLLIKNELLEYHLTDDGDWVYRATEKAKAMSDEEIAKLVHFLVNNMEMQGEDNA